MAHRLARLVYRMLKYGQRYVDKGTEYYEQRYRNQQVQLLRKNATKLGFQITEAQAFIPQKKFLESCFCRRTSNSRNQSKPSRIAQD